MVTLLTTVALAATYRSVSVDKHGQLHIILDTGKEILPPKARDQEAFDSPSISPDHQMVGWLELYPHPSLVTYPLPFRLVVYRNGRLLHTISADQIFWDWQFQDGGRRIAYSTGPTDGGAAQCVLLDVLSGKVLARWSVAREGKAPTWTESLRMN
jgi:hypothetical protein